MYRGPFVKSTFLYKFTLKRYKLEINISNLKP